MNAMINVVFEVDGGHVALSEPEAGRLAERLRGFAAGVFRGDVDLPREVTTDPEWLDGARALADAIEDVLTTTSEGPIPLDPNGKAAEAALVALALSGPVSFDAIGGLSRLYNAIKNARLIA